MRVVAQNFGKAFALVTMRFTGIIIGVGIGLRVGRIWPIGPDLIDKIGIWLQLNTVFAQRLAMGFYLAPAVQPWVKTDRARLQVFLEPCGQARFGPVNGCEDGVCLHFHLNPVAPIYEYTRNIR